MRVLGINAVFHDPSAALVVEAVTVAAAKKERSNRRKHGKDPVAFSTWELPELSARWCLEHAGLTPADLDAVAYSYDPALTSPDGRATRDDWEFLRSLYAARAPRFLGAALPGLDPSRVRFVPHHVAHAASAPPASPFHPAAALRGGCLARARPPPRSVRPPPRRSRRVGPPRLAVRLVGCPRPRRAR